MNKTVSSVIDDINEWPNPQDGGRVVYFVTAFTTDGDVLSAGRKDMDAALEVQGLLQEAIGQELDFQLAANGVSKAGKPKYKILGFGTPGGAATYTAPGVQGNGGSGGGGTAPHHRSPEPSTEASIRASVALKAAVEFGVPRADAINEVLEHADIFEAWLAKTSGASSAYPSTVVVASQQPSTVHQAGAPEDSSASTVKSSAESDSGGGVESKGKEPAPPPHQHDWQPTGLHGKLKCEGCGEMRDREATR